LGRGEGGWYVSWKIALVDYDQSRFMPLTSKCEWTNGAKDYTRDFALHPSLSSWVMLEASKAQWLLHVLDSSWNVMAHGDEREGKWRGNWRMEWVASTLHTTSEPGVSSITNADAHTSAASSRLNWRPRRFKWTRPFRRKTKSDLCACAITFQLACTNFDIKSFYILPTQCICLCFVWNPERTPIISLYSIEWLVFITETECVYCVVRAGSLNMIHVNFHVERVFLLEEWTMPQTSG
jgi:hypothetical protein